MTRAERRRLNRLLNPRIPSSLLLLRLMATEGHITSLRAMEHLDCELQSARNALCRLVRQHHVVVTPAAGWGQYATYRITASGRNVIADAEYRIALEAGNEAEMERLTEIAEHDARRERVEVNLAMARTLVPNSVFALGSARPAPARGLTFADGVRGQVRAAGATA